MTERHDDSSSWGRQREISRAALEFPAAKRAETVTPGTRLADRFEIIRLLGQGGMGSVYEAEDRALETRVAVKILRPEISRSAPARERFRREIQLARQVTHPNVCRLFDLFEESDGESFLSMELLEGESLAERLARQGTLAPDEALPIVQQIVAALSAAHGVGVVHRDLKSGNVMLVPDGDDIRAVVTDFGVAKTMRPDEETLLRLTQTGELLGTPAFMAPEQLEGTEITAAADIYAFGVVMYEMLAGKLPFEGTTPFEIAARRLREEAPSPRDHLPDLDSRWERTILRCLERQPRDRFASVEDISTSLESGIVSLPPSRRRGRVKRIAWAAVAILLSGAAWLLLPRLLSIERTTTETSVPTAQERTTVLVSKFENRTGEDLFDGTVEEAIARDLGNSPFVNLVPRQRIDDILRLMRKAPDARVDAALAEELALRDGDIQAVVTGQVEKLGATYVLSAEISAPEDPTVGGVTQEIRDRAEVAEGIRELSSQVRQEIGVVGSRRRRSQSQLPKVTTPSLRALRLYSEAGEAMRMRENSAAAGLLERAVAEDPDFASGYIQLAYAIRKQDRPQEEYLPYAARAVELVETTTDRERFFILGGYQDMQRQEEKAIQSFEALLRVSPGHYWALERLDALLGNRGQWDRMTPYWVAAAELQPDDLLANEMAGRHLWTIEGRVDEAEPFIQRALELAALKDQWRLPNSIPVLWFFPVHQAWLRGDVETAKEELDRLSSRALELTGVLGTDLAWVVGRNYVILGQLEEAERFYLNMAASGREEGQWHRRIKRHLELQRLDRHQWREVLERNTMPHLGAYEAQLLALAGMVSEARDLMQTVEEPSTTQNFARSRYQAAMGELALTEGEFDEAIVRLEEAVYRRRKFELGQSFFWAIESLARAWEMKGRTETALAVLEDGSQLKPRALGKDAWMDMRLYMADIYRQHGREAEAQAIEDELRNLMRFADSDVRLARQLERRAELYSN